MRYKSGGDGGTGVYMRKGTTSRVTAADRPYGDFYGFTASVRKILDPPTYDDYDDDEIKGKGEKQHTC